MLFERKYLHKPCVVGHLSNVPSRNCWIGTLLNWQLDSRAGCVPAWVGIPRKGHSFSSPTAFAVMFQVAPWACILELIHFSFHVYAVAMPFLIIIVP